MQPFQEPHCPPDILESLNPQVRPGDPPSTSPAVAEPGDDAPHWLPREESWQRLPEPIRRAVHQRILPMWRELVGGADDELERSAAATLVHLTWLEMRGQVELEQAWGDSDPLFSTLVDPERLFARHLQLLTAKQRSAELLRKLRLAREKPAGRQSDDQIIRPSPLFGDLGPRRRTCFPASMAPVFRAEHGESQESNVERKGPENADVADQRQVPPGIVQGNPTVRSDRERDKSERSGASSESTQGVAGRQTRIADWKNPDLDARHENREKDASVQPARESDRSLGDSIDPLHPSG
jgi:hypothetical protein